MKLVYVEWWDHTCWSDNAWKCEEELKKLTPTLFRSIGYVIKEDKSCVWVCSCLSIEEADYQMDGKFVHCILKCAIKKRKNVRI